MTKSVEAKHWMVVGAFSPSLVVFRGRLLQMLRKAAPGVGVSEVAEPAVAKQLAEWGVKHASYPIARSGLDPRQDLRTGAALFQLFRQHQPTHVLAYTIKPVIWSGIALYARPRVRYTAMITGLGYAFERGSVRRVLPRLIASNLYRAALLRADAVIFHNHDNLNVFLKNRLVRANKCHVVDGSGVDTAAFAPEPLPEGPAHFLLIARLLGDKGIREYAAAARLVKAQQPDAIFTLVGPTDPSPDGIGLDEVNDWVDEGIIDYRGMQQDVRPALAACHVYVLPSYHEGMPRTVLEAMATARPILTTDVSGCRETVVPGKNGWLVPKADAEALAQRLLQAIEQRHDWPAMAVSSRTLAEQRFDVDIINQHMARIMGVC